MSFEKLAMEMRAAMSDAAESFPFKGGAIVVVARLHGPQLEPWAHNPCPTASFGQLIGDSKEDYYKVKVFPLVCCKSVVVDFNDGTGPVNCMTIATAKVAACLQAVETGRLTPSGLMPGAMENGYAPWAGGIPMALLDPTGNLVMELSWAVSGGSGEHDLMVAKAGIPVVKETFSRPEWNHYTLLAPSDRDVEAALVAAKNQG